MIALATLMLAFLAAAALLAVPVYSLLPTRQ